MGDHVTLGDQQAPKPAEEPKDVDSNLLGIEDQEAQSFLQNNGRSSSTNKATRERRRTGKKNTSN